LSADPTVDQEVAMSRLCADPVDVQRHDEAPEAFLWRGRVYRVCEVLSAWVEAGPWWRGASAAALAGEQVEPRPGWPADEGERQIWRVEAAAGRFATRGVYDLALEPGTGQWSVARALD
jgi:hypothetical protein